jgi:transposase
LEATEEESMSNRKYTEEFRAEAIKQVTERGYKVREVSERLGISSKSLYLWLRLTRGSNSKQGQGSDSELRQEIVRLRSELKRAEEERDILKKAAAYFASESR